LEVKQALHYDSIGVGYARYRRPDARIAARVHQALGAARTVVNVGAGAGAYEPTDRHVIAVEPSAVMRAQRVPPLPPAINASAEALPLDDQSVDAAMASFTIHHWRDLDKGLSELKRVARGAIAILTFDPEAFEGFWVHEYLPELMPRERQWMPAPSALAEALGEGAYLESVPIPIDCTDGFNEAYYGRPEMFLDEGARNRPR
jgi:SAM-dependent methyltransferase